MYETRVHSCNIFLVRTRSNNRRKKKQKQKTRLTLVTHSRPSVAIDSVTIHTRKKRSDSRGRHLQNSASPGSVGQADGDVSVEPAGSSERRVQHLGSIRSGHDEHAPSLNISCWRRQWFRSRSVVPDIYTRRDTGVLRSKNRANSGDGENGGGSEGCFTSQHQYAMINNRIQAHTELANMSFEKMFHLAAEVCVFFLLQNKRVFSRNLPLFFVLLGVFFVDPRRKSVVLLFRVVLPSLFYSI